MAGHGWLQPVRQSLLSAGDGKQAKPCGVEQLNRALEPGDGFGGKEGE